jgi:hypothetical protein
MNPWRKLRDGKTGIAVKRSSPRSSIMKYVESDISAASRSASRATRWNRPGMSLVVEKVRSMPSGSTSPVASEYVLSKYVTPAYVIGSFASADPP